MSERLQTASGSTTPGQSPEKIRERLDVLFRVLAGSSDCSHNAARDLVRQLLREYEEAAMYRGSATDGVPASDKVSLRDRVGRRTEDWPETERLPVLIEASFHEVGHTVSLVINNEQIGHVLTDKSVVPDGYRFHDAFHLAHAAVLGWSPILRAFLRRRRRSCPDVDDCEDGGRAQMIEEAVSHVVFVHGRDGNDVSDPARVDGEFTDYLCRLTAGLEVEDRTHAEWARAITQGWRAFDALRTGACRTVIADAVGRRLLLR